jgi:hypothetical protein
MIFRYCFQKDGIAGLVCFFIEDFLDDRGGGYTTRASLVQRFSRKMGFFSLVPTP